MKVNVEDKCVDLPPLKPTPNNQRLPSFNDGPVIECALIVWDQGSIDGPEEAEEGLANSGAA